MKKLMLLLFVLLYGCHAFAEAIALRDYVLLRRGMTEAEVLYRIGTFDRETIRSNRYDSILSRSWFYIPTQKSANKWISEFRFDANARLIFKDRFRVRK